MPPVSRFLYATLFRVRTLIVGVALLAALMTLSGPAAAKKADIRGYSCANAPAVQEPPPILAQEPRSTEGLEEGTTVTSVPQRPQPNEPPSELEPVCPEGKVPQPIGKKGEKGKPPKAGQLPPPAPSPSGNYSYAGKHQGVNAHQGTYAFLSHPSPFLQDGVGHSLAEIAVRASNDSNDIVEIGWTVDRNLYGDTQPRLFVFHWINGVPQCYNGCGYVQTSATMGPGMAVPVTGSTSEYRLQVSGGTWSVYYRGERLGYFPSSRWGGSFIRSGFHQWFGEVNAPTATPCTDMGNAIFGSNPGAARIDNTVNIIDRYTLQTSTPQAPNDVTNTSWYNLSPGRSFGYGGPGGC